MSHKNRKQPSEAAELSALDSLVRDAQHSAEIRRMEFEMWAELQPYLTRKDWKVYTNIGVLIVKANAPVPKTGGRNAKGRFRNKHQGLRDALSDLRESDRLMKSIIERAQAQLAEWHREPDAPVAPVARSSSMPKTVHERLAGRYAGEKIYDLDKGTYRIAKKWENVRY